MPDIRYERLHTPRASYTMLRDGRAVAVVSKTQSGQWVASTVRGPAITVPACFSRHEAGMALLGKLAELGAL